MFVWYLATAVAAAWFVFRDPGFDYRLLLVGAVLPIADGLTGGVWILHSITASVVVLIAVMLVTVRRPALRKRLLGLPMGMMLYLVFSGAWSNANAFWWPFGGFTVDDAPLPVAERGWGWSLLLEALGVLIAARIWRAAGLRSSCRRREFVSTGHLDFVAR